MPLTFYKNLGGKKVHTAAAKRSIWTRSLLTRPKPSLLPAERKTKYRKYLAGYPTSWWDPTAIWAKWKAMLDELKIASPTAWK
jgi:hypothetical protein